MFRRSIAVSAMAAIAVALAAPAGGAGVEIAIETTAPGGDAATQESGRIWIDGPKLRLESGASGNAVIFRADREVLWSLDASSRSYLQFDRETGQAIETRVAQARREMDARMAQLPPEQRAMAERMMSGKMPGAPGAGNTASRPPLEIRETDETRSIDGKSCRVFQLIRAGETHGDACVADWETAGVKPGELAVFGALAEFQRELVGQLGIPPAVALEDQPFEVFDELDGFPLESRRIRKGAVTSRTRFLVVEKNSPHQNLFEPPPGYTRRSNGPLGPEPG